MNSTKAFEHYTDLEAIQKILSGESRLYEILIRRNNPYLYRIGRSYGYSHHDVEDLMQETYISAYKSLSAFKHASSFKTWLTRIMLNHCYQKKQKLSYQKEVLLANNLSEKQSPMFQKSNNAGAGLINKELAHILENALTRLPEDHRMVFTFRELNGLSVAETAELTDLSEANVKTCLSRAKSRLRAEVEKMYDPADIFEFNLIYCDRIVENVMSLLAKESA